jgi:hypothetical protein
MRFIPYRTRTSRRNCGSGAIAPRDVVMGTIVKAPAATDAFVEALYRDRN